MWERNCSDMHVGVNIVKAWCVCCRLFEPGQKGTETAANICRVHIGERLQQCVVLCMRQPSHMFEDRGRLLLNQ